MMPSAGLYAFKKWKQNVQNAKISMLDTFVPYKQLNIKRPEESGDCYRKRYIREKLNINHF